MTCYKCGVNVLTIMCAYMVQAESTSSLPTIPQPRSANCNFTSSDDSCGYTLGDRWVLRTGPYLYKQRAKLISSGEGDKTYALFDFERNATNSSEATANEMTSPDIPTGTYNVSFWYIAPATKSQLELVRIDARGKETVIWTGKGERGATWKHWHMDISVTQQVRIAFRGTISILHGRKATSIIGVDKIEITKIDMVQAESTSSLPTIPQPRSANCNFTSSDDSCGYTLGDRWVLRTGPYLYKQRAKLISSGEGDKTYALFDFERNATNSSEATANEMTSPDIPTGTYNVSFWYIAPATKSQLELVRIDARGKETVIWTGKGERGATWKHWHMDISVTQQVRIAFRGTISILHGRKATSIIGVDKIEITKIDMVQAESTSSLPTIPQPRSANCNFTSSDDSCGYTLGDRWVLRTGPYLYKQRAKLISSGEGDKTYALFDFERNATNSSEATANEMTSPDIRTGTYNVSFWYIAPATKSQLELVRFDARGKETVIWTGKGERGATWKHWHMDISVTQQVRIGFRGTISILHDRKATSVIGVDKIEITKIAPNPSTALHTTETDLTTSASRVSTRVPSKSVTSIKPPLSSARMHSARNTKGSSMLLPSSHRARKQTKPAIKTSTVMETAKVRSTVKTSRTMSPTVTSTKATSKSTNHKISSKSTTKRQRSTVTVTYTQTSVSTVTKKSGPSGGMTTAAENPSTSSRPIKMSTTMSQLYTTTSNLITKIASHVTTKPTAPTPLTSFTTTIASNGHSKTTLPLSSSTKKNINTHSSPISPPEIHTTNANERTNLTAASTSFSHTSKQTAVTRATNPSKSTVTSRASVSTTPIKLQNTTDISKRNRTIIPHSPTSTFLSTSLSLLKTTTISSKMFTMTTGSLPQSLDPTNTSHMIFSTKVPSKQTSTTSFTNSPSSQSMANESTSTVSRKVPTSTAVPGTVTQTSTTSTLGTTTRTIPSTTSTLGTTTRTIPSTTSTLGTTTRTIPSTTSTLGTTTRTIPSTSSTLGTTTRTIPSTTSTLGTTTRTIPSTSSTLGTTTRTIPSTTSTLGTTTRTIPSTTSTLGTTTRTIPSYSAYTYSTTVSRNSKPSTSIITFTNALSTTIHSRTQTSINSSQDAISTYAAHQTSTSGNPSSHVNKTSTGVSSYTHGATVDSESTALIHSTHNSASTHIPATNAASTHIAATIAASTHIAATNAASTHITATNAASFQTSKANTPSKAGQPAQKSSPRTTPKQTTRVPLITSSKNYKGNANSQKEKDSIKTTTIIGIVIGVIAAVLIALGVLYLYMRSKAKGVANPVSGYIDEEEATFDHYTQRTSRELRLQTMTGTVENNYTAEDMQPTTTHEPSNRYSNRSFQNSS